MHPYKTLFYFTILCISTVLAEFRRIPDQSKISCEENRLPFIRNLDADRDNKKAEPVTVRLQGNIELGYYYVTLFMGSPVQKQTLIVDTGSVTTAVPCVECGHDCGIHHFNKPFNDTDSKSFEKFKCGESFGEYNCSDCAQHCPFEKSYGEGSSYKGHFNKDFIVFGNEIEDNYSLLKQNIEGLTTEESNIRKSVEQTIEERRVFMPFGCIIKETKLFYDQKGDGILGLGLNTNTRSSPPNILDALNIRDYNSSKAFSLCLAQNGGYFTFEGYNAAYHLPDAKTQYTKYSDTSGQYTVFIDKIEMEGDNIGLESTALNSGEGAFFDSGTTFTRVPIATYNALKKSMESFCEGDNQRCGGKAAETTSLCWEYNTSRFSSLSEFSVTFPTFTVVLGREEKSNYEWKAEDYLYEDGNNTYCFGITDYKLGTFLGGTFMKNHDILFDKENKRIGFVRANCGAVQQVVNITYSEEKKKTTKTNIPEDNESYATKNSKNTDFWEDLVAFNKVIKVAIAIFIVSVLIIVLFCVFRRCIKKRIYSPMRNLSPLNVNAAQTATLKEDQFAQEEKLELEFSAEGSSTEIRVE